MIRTIYLQLAAALLAVCLAALFAGARGAVSAVLAGVVCILPCAWFTLRLSKMTRQTGGASAPQFATQFFVGEFVKIAATVLLLLIAVKIYQDVHWPSLLLGMILVLQASFLAFWKKS
ncbi:MAG: ATP synthase subunit I [Zoogloeaceae bacterium]|jgi:ATP synthase protein I|nr:ATP synthase subunit I [Zoogloeaceae bacterium]